MQTNKDKLVNRCVDGAMTSISYQHSSDSSKPYVSVGPLLAPDNQREHVEHLRYVCDDGALRDLEITFGSDDHSVCSLQTNELDEEQNYSSALSVLYGSNDFPLVQVPDDDNNCGSDGNLQVNHSANDDNDDDDDSVIGDCFVIDQEMEDNYERLLQELLSMPVYDPRCVRRRVELRKLAAAAAKPLRFHFGPAEVQVYYLSTEEQQEKKLAMEHINIMAHHAKYLFPQLLRRVARRSNERADIARIHGRLLKELSAMRHRNPRGVRRRVELHKLAAAAAKPLRFRLGIAEVLVYNLTAEERQEKKLTIEHIGIKAHHAEYLFPQLLRRVARRSQKRAREANHQRMKERMFQELRHFTLQHRLNSAVMARSQLITRFCFLLIVLCWITTSTRLRLLPNQSATNSLISIATESVPIPSSAHQAIHPVPTRLDLVAAQHPTLFPRPSIRAFLREPALSMQVALIPQLDSVQIAPVLPLSSKQLTTVHIHQNVTSRSPPFDKFQFGFPCQAKTLLFEQETSDGVHWGQNSTTRERCITPNCDQLTLNTWFTRRIWNRRRGRPPRYDYFTYQGQNPRYTWNWHLVHQTRLNCMELQSRKMMRSWKRRRGRPPRCENTEPQNRILRRHLRWSRHRSPKCESVNLQNRNPQLTWRRRRGRPPRCDHTALYCRKIQCALSRHRDCLPRFEHGEEVPKSRKRNRRRGRPPRPQTFQLHENRAQPMRQPESLDKLSRRTWSRRRGRPPRTQPSTCKTRQLRSGRRRRGRPPRLKIGN